LVVELAEFIGDLRSELTKAVAAADLNVLRFGLGRRSWSTPMSDLH
jgi:hypothetical protein